MKVKKGYIYKVTMDSKGYNLLVLDSITNNVESWKKIESRETLEEIRKLLPKGIELEIAVPVSNKYNSD